MGSTSLNAIEEWRHLAGPVSPRMKDQELILSSPPTLVNEDGHAVVDMSVPDLELHRLLS